MGVSQAVASQVPPDNSKWGPWNANLIFVHHRKCVLFVHARSLANFFVGDISRAELRDIGTIFRNGFGRFLLQEDFPAPLVETLLSEYKDWILATAHDRTVQGSMTDLAAHYKYAISETGNLTPESLAGPIREMNRMPMGALKFAFAIEEFRSILGLERRVEKSGSIHAL